MGLTQWFHRHFQEQFPDIAQIANEVLVAKEPGKLD